MTAVEADTTTVLEAVRALVPRSPNERMRSRRRS